MADFSYGPPAPKVLLTLYCAFMIYTVQPDAPAAEMCVRVEWRAFGTRVCETRRTPAPENPRNRFTSECISLRVVTHYDCE